MNIGISERGFLSIDGVLLPVQRLENSRLIAEVEDFIVNHAPEFRWWDEGKEGQRLEQEAMERDYEAMGVAWAGGLRAETIAKITIA